MRPWSRAFVEHSTPITTSRKKRLKGITESKRYKFKWVKGKTRGVHETLFQPFFFFLASIFSNYVKKLKKLSACVTISAEKYGTTVEERMWRSLSKYSKKKNQTFWSKVSIQSLLWSTYMYLTAMHWNWPHESLKAYVILTILGTIYTSFPKPSVW